MKERISVSKIMKEVPHVFYAGYCELQDLLIENRPMFYNSGVYGWNCDIYYFNLNGYEIAIITGYRNLRGKPIPTEMIKRWSIEESLCNNKYERLETEYNFLSELLSWGKNN